MRIDGSRRVACAALALAMFSGVRASIAADIAPAERAALIPAIADMLVAEYVDPALAAQMARTIRAHARKGDYDRIADGQALADRLKTDLRDVSHDGHLWIGYHPEGAEDEPESPTIAQMDAWRAGAAADNVGFRKVERMDGNVGYVEFVIFAYPYLAADKATQAMRFVADTDALIIDLRRNGGGDPAMVAYVLSYLFDTRTHLNDLRHRRGDRLEQFWTSTVPGPVFGGTKPVFVLTSHATFSGAEDFTYALKNLKRARIVGEPTGGGAHPTREFKVTDHFTVAVPYAESVSPITHANWEGRGVVPDIAVPAGDALRVAYRAALEGLRDATQDAERRRGLQALLDGPGAGAAKKSD